MSAKPVLGWLFAEVVQPITLPDTAPALRSHLQTPSPTEVICAACRRSSLTYKINIMWDLKDLERNRLRRRCARNPQPTAPTPSGSAIP